MGTKPLGIIAFMAAMAVLHPGCVRNPATDDQAALAARAPTIQAAPAARVQGAWRVVETAVQVPGGAWDARPAPQGGLYVFTSRHYSYFYVRSAEPRRRFIDANQPTEAEKAAAYDSFIAGAGSYTFNGRTLELKADFRKNPNEMTGEVWRLQTEERGDTLLLVFEDPPFLPGRTWRTTLVRAVR